MRTLVGGPDPARRAEVPGRGRHTNDHRGATYYASSHTAELAANDAALIFSDLFTDWSALRGNWLFNR